MIQHHQLTKVFSYLDKNELLNVVLPFYEKNEDHVLTRKIFDISWTHIENELHFSHNRRCVKGIYQYYCLNYPRLINWISDNSIYFQYFFDKLSDKEFMYVMKRGANSYNYYIITENKNFEKIYNLSLHHYIYERLNRICKDKRFIRGKSMLFTDLKSIKLKRWDILQDILLNQPEMLSYNTMRRNIMKIQNYMYKNIINIEDYNTIKMIYTDIMKRKELNSNLVYFESLEKKYKFDVSFYLKILCHVKNDTKSFSLFKKTFIELLNKNENEEKIKLSNEHVKYFLNIFDANWFYHFYLQCFEIQDDLYENLIIPLYKDSNFNNYLEFFKLLKDDVKYKDNCKIDKDNLDYNINLYEKDNNNLEYFKEIVYNLQYLEYLLKEHGEDLKNIKLKIEYSMYKINDIFNSGRKTNISMIIDDIYGKRINWRNDFKIKNLYQLLFYVSIKECHQESYDLFYKYNNSLQKPDKMIYIQFFLYHFQMNEKNVDFYIKNKINPDASVLEFYILTKQSKEFKLLLDKGCETDSILYLAACKVKRDDIFEMLLKKNVFFHKDCISLCLKLIEINIKIDYCSSYEKILELMIKYNIEPKKTELVYLEYKKKENAHKTSNSSKSSLLNLLMMGPQDYMFM